MLKYLFASLLATISLFLHAQQNVGIGTTTPNAKLEITAGNPATPTNQDGLLIPRVDAFPAANPGSNQNGMMVYLTTTAGANLPGFYYWNNGTTSWKPVGDGKFWGLAGNAGTNPAIHFFGTTDNQDLIFKRNNLRGGLLSLINTSWGVEALNPSTTGTGNTANGYQALFSNTSGNNNVANGDQALRANTTGYYNTANGYASLYSNTTGINNVANGYQALFFNTAGYNNTANGFAALRFNSTGFANTATGHSALFSNTIGAGNVANGFEALFLNTMGNNNTASGYHALYSNETGSDNTVIGYEAMRDNLGGQKNTVVGRNALRFKESGNENVAMGFGVLLNNQTGGKNTALGYAAGYDNNGSNNVFIGFNAGFQETGSHKLYIANNGADANDAFIYGEFDNKILRVNGNMGIGTAPNAKLEIAASNVATPTNQDGILIPRVNAFAAANPGSNQNGMMVYLTTTVGVNLPGFYYWNNGTTSWKAVGDGKFWGLAGNAGTIAGTHFLGTTDNTPFSIRVNNAPGARIDHIKLNTFLGSGAGNVNTTGERNIAIGSDVLKVNSNGEKNTVMGVSAMEFNQTGSNNTVMGYDAMQDNIGGNKNTAIGANALYRKQSGVENVAIGLSALDGNVIGSKNTALGYQAGYSNNGSGNVFIGYNAGINETGSNKLFISNNNNGNANNALIYGEFDNNKLQVNNKLGIGLLPASFPLEIKGIGVNSDLIKFYNNAGTPKWHMNLYSDGSLGYTETDVADNRLVLKPGGEVGIGKQPLTTSTDSRLQVKQKGNQNGIGIEAAASVDHWDFWVDGSSFLQLVYNGVLKGYFNNTSGAYIQSSDRRLKKSITVQLPVLKNLMQLQAYQYHYLENKPADNFSNGFMAQDVLKIFPDAVIENEMKDGEKRLGINYQYFTVVAITAIQEQQKIIDSYERKIESQDERIKKLEAQVQLLLEKK